MVDYDKLAEDLMAFREHNNITQREVGEILGFSGGTISNIERNIKSVRHDTRMAVRTALDKVLEETVEAKEGSMLDCIKEYAIETVRVDKVAELITKLSSASKWIRCDERLPEEFGDAHNTQSESVNVTAQFAYNRKVFISRTVNGQWEIESKYKCKIIAWQPLPKVYEGDLC